MIYYSSGNIGENFNCLKTVQGNDHIYIGTLGGGGIDTAKIVSEILNNHFKKIYIFSVFSCGIIPFLTFPKKQKFIHTTFNMFIHSFSAEDLSVNLKEFSGFKDALLLDVEYTLNLLKNNKVKNYDKFKEVFKYNDYSFFSAQDCIKFNLIHKNNLIKKFLKDTDTPNKP